MKKTLLFLALSIVGGVLGQQTNILFIGNSYTYGNDLPTLLRQLSIANGKNVFVDSHTVGGASFYMHNTSAAAQQKIKQKNWDYVLIQGQSQEVSFPDQQVDFNVLPPAVSLTDSIYRHHFCSEVMFFMTWGRKNGDPQWGPISTFEGMQERLYDGYMRIADSSQASVAAVGRVWQRLREQMPNVELYEPDQSHPSLAGSFLAAMTIYSSIFLELPQVLVGNQGLSTAFTDLVKQIIDVEILREKSRYHLRPKSEHTQIENLEITQLDDVIQGEVSTRKAQRVEWDFGDHTQAQGWEVTKDYADLGTFTIQVKAISACSEDAENRVISVDVLELLALENDLSDWFVLSGKTMNVFGEIGVVYNLEGKEVIRFQDVKELDFLNSGVYLLLSNGKVSRFYLP